MPMKRNIVGHPNFAAVCVCDTHNHHHREQHTQTAAAAVQQRLLSHKKNSTVSKSAPRKLSL